MTAELMRFVLHESNLILREWASAIAAQDVPRRGEMGFQGLYIYNDHPEMPSEPMLNGDVGAPRLEALRSPRPWGWTLSSAEMSLALHFEHACNRIRATFLALR